MALLPQGAGRATLGLKFLALIFMGQADLVASGCDLLLALDNAMRYAPAAWGLKLVTAQA